ncbi:glutamate formimidoyltransferase [Bacteroidia bacterium]|nr:glutamate formimidoyltransferase [Bacteroidia bacterium]
MQKLIECVPNFSEGSDGSTISHITDAMQKVTGVNVLHVDVGKAANRTVVTMVGEAVAVCEAAFQGVKRAAELIDMSKHKGTHPRMGATDVCPLIPIANISMTETVALARTLSKRVGEELRIPVYCYEHAAFAPERKRLETCRSGEYEGLKVRLQGEQGRPDFGPQEWDDRVCRTGATVIGARNILVAYNINLDTTSAQMAHAIACDVRESGRGKALPGTLKAVKAMGWYIEEYGCAQVSMNLTDIAVTPLHIAFEEVCKRAVARGVRVTGSELIGLIPLQCLLDAGRYFLSKQGRACGVSEGVTVHELIEVAVKALGLDDLQAFEVGERVIEYRMGKV